MDPLPQDQAQGGAHDLKRPAPAGNVPVGKRVRMRNPLFAALIATAKKEDSIPAPTPEPAPEPEPEPAEEPTPEGLDEAQVYAIAKQHNLSPVETKQFLAIETELFDLEMNYIGKQEPRRAAIRPIPKENSVYSNYSLGDLNFVPPAKKPTAPVAPAGRAGRQPKPAAARSVYDQESRLSGDLAKAFTILKSLTNHAMAWPFLQPVDPVALGIPDYFNVITQPMDLGTIRDRMMSGFYTDAQKVVADIRLTFNNAKVYNPPGTDVHIMADKLTKIFEDRWKRPAGASNPQNTAMMSKTVADLKDSIKYVQAEINALKRDRKQRKAVIVGAAPKPARPAPRKQAEPEATMTWEEKAKLTGAINELDEEHLATVVNIIQDRNPQLAENAQSDLIEIDLEVVDDGTLRALEKFVISIQKKKTNKQNRSAVREPRTTQEKIQKYEELQRQLAQIEGDGPPAANEPAKKEDEVVDIGGAADTAPGQTFPPVVVQEDKKESSSSSSSTSASSDSSSDEPVPAAPVPMAANPTPASTAETPAVANPGAWSNLTNKSETAEQEQGTLWSDFKAKDEQNKQREQQRIEQEEQARQLKVQQDLERKQREEQLRKEKEEAEAKAQADAKKVEEEAQKRLMEKREAARRAREEATGEVDLDAQRMQMQNFEKGLHN